MNAKLSEIRKSPPQFGALIGIPVGLAVVLLVWQFWWVSIFLVPLVLCLAIVLADFFGNMNEMANMIILYSLAVLQWVFYGWFIGSCISQKKYGRLALVFLFIHIIPLVLALLWNAGVFRNI